jgi:hypothetical protein
MPKKRKPRIWRIRDGARVACRRLVAERDGFADELGRARRDLLETQTSEREARDLVASLRATPEGRTEGLERMHAWLRWVVETFLSDHAARHLLLSSVPGTDLHESALAWGHVDTLGLPTEACIRNMPAAAALATEGGKYPPSPESTPPAPEPPDWRVLAHGAIDAFDPTQPAPEPLSETLQTELAAARRTIQMIASHCSEAQSPAPAPAPPAEAGAGSDAPVPWRYWCPACGGVQPVGLSPVPPEIPCRSCDGVAALVAGEGEGPVIEP